MRFATSGHLGWNFQVGHADWNLVGKSWVRLAGLGSLNQVFSAKVRMDFLGRFAGWGLLCQVYLMVFGDWVYFVGIDLGFDWCGLLDKVCLVRCAGLGFHDQDCWVRLIGLDFLGQNIRTLPGCRLFSPTSRNGYSCITKISKFSLSTSP